MTRRGTAVLAVLLLGALLSAAALLNSERGMQWALQFAQRTLPGELRWRTATGRLLGPLTLEDVTYRDATGVYGCARLAFDWAPGQLLARRLSVQTLHLDNVTIELAEREAAAAESPDAGWALPLEVVLHDFAANAVRIRHGTSALLVIEGINAAIGAGQGSLDVQTFRLRLPQGEISAQGRLGVGRAAVSDLVLNWRAKLPGYAPLAARGSLKGTWESLQLEQTFTAPQAAQLRLHIEQPFAALRWDAELALPRMALTAIDPEWPALQLGGVLRADGTLRDYRLAVDARSEGAGLPPAAVTATAQGDRNGLRVESLRLQTLNGVVQGEAQVAWAPRLQWAAQVQAADIDPGTHWADWPGKLSAAFTSHGEDTGQGLALKTRIDSLAGTLRGYPLQGRGAFDWAQDAWRLDAVQLQSGDARIALDGTVAGQWDVRWQVQAPQLQQLLPDISGAVEASGTLSGARAQPRLRAKAQLREVGTAAAQVGALRLDADLSLQPRAPLRLTAHGTSVRLAERRFDRLDIALDGSLERHAFSAQAQGPGHALNLEAHGGWNAAQWTGRLARADWQLPAAGAWTLDKPVSVRLGARQGAIEPLCWSQAPARLCAHYDYDARERRLRAELADWPLASLQERLPHAVRVEGSALAAQLAARLPAAGNAQAQAEARISAGTLRWEEGGQHWQAPFAGDAQLQLDATGLRGAANLRLSGSDHVNARAELPGYRPGMDPAQQRLLGRLRGEVRDFSVLDSLVESVDAAAGVLRLDAELAGTVATPQLHGGVQLTEGRAFIGPAGVQLQDVNLALDADPGGAALRLHGGARSGSGLLRIDGRFTQVGQSAALQADMRLSGADFEVVNLPEARVLATPDLHATLRGRTLAVDGTLLIPEARIEPRDLSNAVTPSRDAVRVDAPVPASPSGWTVNSRVRVTLGERVMFDGYGLRGRLTGALDILEESGKPTHARGELAVRDGTYTAYGEKLKIEQGRVLYRDSPLDNPNLDVRATRTSDDEEVVAGVRVLGTARDPRAELYSQPPLPQDEALSYLMLGRSMEDTSGSEGELLFKAASTLGLKGGAQMAQGIRRRFGLDEVSLGGSEDEGTAFKLGKYLSPRLYLNYSIGLLDTADKIQLRYRLTKHLSVQTETGTDTGGDVLYTIER